MDSIIAGVIYGGICFLGTKLILAIIEFRKKR